MVSLSDKGIAKAGMILGIVWIVLLILGLVALELVCYQWESML